MARAVSAKCKCVRAVEVGENFTHFSPMPVSEKVGTNLLPVGELNSSGFAFRLVRTFSRSMFFFALLFAVALRSASG